MLALVLLASPQAVEELRGFAEHLGSADLEVRDRAAERLAAAGEAARPWLKAVLQGPDPEAAGRARGLLARLDRFVRLDRLLARYLEFDLPLPPAEARLVRCPSGSSSFVDGREVPHWTLGFRWEEEAPEAGIRILKGTFTDRTDEEGISTELAADAIVPANLETASRFEFEMNSFLATALQAYATGRREFGARLLDDCLRVKPDVFVYRDPRVAWTSPESALALLIWTQQLTLLNAEGDRSLTAKRLRKLLEEEPILDHPRNRSLVEGLEVAEAPRRGAPGSLDARVEALLDSPSDLSDDQRPPAMMDLFALGLDALPALLDHRQDPRLGRYFRNDSFRSIPSYPWTLGAMVDDLLQNLAGGTAWNRWVEGEATAVVVKERATAWAAQVRAEGEERHFVQRALPEGDWPEAGALRILSVRYPAALAVVYRTLLKDRPGMQSWPVAQAVARSRLPEGERVGLLKEGLRHATLRHPYAALLHLQELKARDFPELLIDALDRLPLEDPQARSFSLLVRRGSDFRVWEALHRVLRRAAPELRPALLEDAAWSGTPADVRRPQVAFLVRCLEPEFGTEVRATAAQALAEILRLPKAPGSSASESEWIEFRKDVDARRPVEAKR